MKRTQFAEAHMNDNREALAIGSLKPNDVIESEKGLVARVDQERIGYYVVVILDGSPFLKTHASEIRYVPALERYEIDERRIKNWRRKAS